MARLAVARMDPGAASGKMGSRATEEEMQMYVHTCVGLYHVHVSIFF